MSTYIVCQERHVGKWRVCVYAISACDKIVDSMDELGGWVQVGRKKHNFKMGIFANDQSCLDAVNEVNDWCSEDNETEELEAKDGNTPNG